MASNTVVEIERKYLITKLPDLKLINRFDIKQTYIQIGDTEERVRKIFDGLKTYYVYTKKEKKESESGYIERYETEFEISKENYEEALKAGIKEIRKTRYVYHNKHNQEFTIDKIEAKNNSMNIDLLLLEVEYEDFEHFYFPKGIGGKEVSNQHQFKNQVLAKFL